MITPVSQTTCQKFDACSAMQVVMLRYSVHNRQARPGLHCGFISRIFCTTLPEFGVQKCVLCIGAVDLCSLGTSMTLRPNSAWNYVSQMSSTFMFFDLLFFAGCPTTTITDDLTIFCTQSYARKRSSIHRKRYRQTLFTVPTKCCRCMLANANSVALPNNLITRAQRRPLCIYPRACRCPQLWLKSCYFVTPVTILRLSIKAIHHCPFTSG